MKTTARAAGEPRSPLSGQSVSNSLEGLLNVKVLTLSSATVVVTIYSYNDTASCFFSNANQTTDTTISFQDNQFILVLAWSVSILPNWKTETYNTAKARTIIASTVKAIVDERIGNGEVSKKQGDFLQILLFANTLYTKEITHIVKIGAF
ncbi:hypothetical protein Syun_012605 [Stephania yunnanensis]|uniref:Beta-galactosidase beta-sandwich domain-containing protein n=1 Tax=Stephania yunnanensis TaxID=152371 RepID=A0AAP0K1Y9_9MAGN